MAEIKTLSFAEGVTVAAPALTTWEVETPDGTVPAEVVNVAYLEGLGIAGQNNISATTDPGATNDDTEGYTVGSRWVNVTLDTHWIALDVSTGAAIWKQTVDTNSTQVFSNKSFSDSVTIGGDLTVNGTTTTINTANLDVEDVNITVNNGGNQATADGFSGLTVEMSDATDVTLIYDSTLPSRWKAGDLGSEIQLANVSSSQTFTNKLIDADANTITNIDNSDIKAGANISRDKLASGTAFRIVANNGSGVMAENAAITANRALASDANGQLVASATTDTELGFVSGVTSAIQTQIDGKLDDVLTTNGDLLYENTGEQRLPIGSAGEVLTVVGGLPAWTAPGSLSIFDVETIAINTNAVSGKTYLVDTSGGSINVTLPTPVASAYIRIKDITGSFRANNCNILRNGSEEIDTVAATYVLNSELGAWLFLSDGTDWFVL